MFARFARLVWETPDGIEAHVPNGGGDPFGAFGFDTPAVQELEVLGLVMSVGLGMHITRMHGRTHRLVMRYGDSVFELSAPSATTTGAASAFVKLTKAGAELARVACRTGDLEYLATMLKHWGETGGITARDVTDSIRAGTYRLSDPPVAPPNV
jgi:hypothetical protein